MTCDNCGVSFDYCFYIDDRHWLSAVSERRGHWCAHCVLQKLGGRDWYVVWNEPGAKVRDNLMEEARCP